VSQHAWSASELRDAQWAHHCHKSGLVSFSPSTPHLVEESCDVNVDEQLPSPLLACESLKELPCTIDLSPKHSAIGLLPCSEASPSGVEVVDLLNDNSIPVFVPESLAPGHDVCPLVQHVVKLHAWAPLDTQRSVAPSHHGLTQPVKRSCVESDVGEPSPAKGDLVSDLVASKDLKPNIDGSINNIQLRSLIDHPCEDHCGLSVKRLVGRKSSFARRLLKKRKLIMPPQHVKVNPTYWDTYGDDYQFDRHEYNRWDHLYGPFTMMVRHLLATTRYLILAHSQTLSWKEM
jgi:hypothetical protein